MTESILELDGVTKQYGALRPLRVEHLVVAAGEQVALLGFDQPAAEVLINLITGASLPDTGLVRVFGRSTAGISFSPNSTEPVRLIFLLVTPADRPSLQVFFLAQLANVAKSEFVREKLRQAKTPIELLEIIEAADPAVTG